MEKKKVTLSLEEDVVEKAKQQGLNMSKAANDALKERTILSNLSKGERKFRKIMEDARKEGNVASLPMKIEKLEIKNIGKFEHKELDFSSEDTVILGPNESGKTTIIRVFKSFFGEEEQDIINFQEKSGEINIVTEENSGKITIKKDEPTQGKCLVIDDLLTQLSDKKAKEAVKELKENYSEQIILTTRRKSIAEEFDNQIRLTSVSEDRLAELRDELEEVHEQLSNKKARYSDLADELEDIEMKYEELVSERGKIESKKESIEHLNEQIEETKVELDHEKSNLDSIEEKISETESQREIGRFEERKKQTEAEVDELKKRLKELKEEREDIESHLEEQEEQEDKLNRLKMKKERKNEQISEIKDEIKALRKEKTHLKSEIEEVKDKL